MARQKITLAQGEEILVNGFVVRAIGPADKPNGLSIYHDRVMVDHLGDIEKEKEQRKYHVYAGISDRVQFESTICVGLVKDLAKCGNDNALTAQNYLEGTDN